MRLPTTSRPTGFSLCVNRWAARCFARAIRRKRRKFFARTWFAIEEWAIFVRVVAESGGAEQGDRRGLGEEPVRGGLEGCGCDAGGRKSVKFEVQGTRKRKEKM